MAALHHFFLAFLIVKFNNDHFEKKGYENTNRHTRYKSVNPQAEGRALIAQGVPVTSVTKGFFHFTKE